MRLSVLPLLPADLPKCAPLWGGREGLSAGDLQRAVSEAMSLVERGLARGRVFVDGVGQVRAFGCSTFVTDACARALLAEPTQLFGTRLLLDPQLREAVLNESATAKGNAGDGLALLVLSQGYHVSPSETTAGEWETLLGAMMHAFVETHRGYNVSLILNEVFGSEGMEAIELAASSDLEILARFESCTEHGELTRSLCWTLSRAVARRRRSLLLPLFVYAPPLLRFTPSEQALLRHALRGATDRELSTLLGISLTAVKGRWTRIQARVSDELPALLNRERSLGQFGTRGTQVRHLVLDYLRLHPSELTPYEPPVRVR